MAKSLHKAKFFCSNCGELVPQNAKFCSKCGKFFTFVRCPNCMHTGEAKSFTNGCPKCGYAVKPYGGLPSSKSKNKKTSPIFGGLRNQNSRNAAARTYDSSLPVWIYVVTLAVLVAVIFGVYSCL